MQQSRAILSPYLSQEQAATFVNRKERTFRDYVKKFKIPRYGPARNQYLVDDLRAFMENPYCFLKNKPAPNGRSFGYTPVSI